MTAPSSKSQHPGNNLLPHLIITTLILLIYDEDPERHMHGNVTGIPTPHGRTQITLELLLPVITTTLAIVHIPTHSPPTRRNAPQAGSLAGVRTVSPMKTSNSSFINECRQTVVYGDSYKCLV